MSSNTRELKYKGDHCRDCIWFNMEDKRTIGYACINPEKKWRNSCSKYRQPSTRACKKYYKRLTPIDLLQHQWEIIIGYVRNMHEEV